MIYGTFKNARNEDIEVTIQGIGVGQYHVETLNSGETRAQVYFSDDPVTIQSEDNDVDDPLVVTKCSIELFTRVDFTGQLFAANIDSIECHVINRATNTILFFGYVEPLSFNQDYSEKYNKLSIKAIDMIGALKYRKYLNKDYDTAMADAEIRTFRSAINDICNLYPNGHPIGYQPNTYSITTNIFFILLNGLTTTQINNINSNFDKRFNDIAVLGSKDEHATCNKVLKTLLTYFGYKIYCYNGNFFIYDPTMFLNANVNSIQLMNLNTGNLSSISTIICSSYANDENNLYIDKQYDITVADIYTKIKINCDRKELDDLTTDIFGDNIDTDYPQGEELYLREFGLYGRPYCANFQRMCRGHYNEQTHEYEGGSIEYDSTGGRGWTRDHYFQKLKNQNWDFYTASGDNMDDITLAKQTQWMDKATSLQHHYGPMLCQITSEDTKKKVQNTTQIQYATNKYIIWPILGNGESENSANRFPKYDDITNNDGMITYYNLSEVNYTPPTDGVTNYIVFSGKIGYMPRNATTWLKSNANTNSTNPFGTTFGDIMNAGTYTTQQIKFGTSYNTYSGWKPEYETVDRSQLWWNTLSRSGGDLYYAMAAYSSDNNGNPVLERNWLPFYPMCNDVDSKQKKLDYNYSQTGGNTNDKIAKLSVLNCRLRIGTKYLKENFVEDNKGIKQSQFEWVDESDVPAGEDMPTFTLGFDPDIGDMILGTMYSMENNVSRSMRIDKKGTAIPITFEDNIHGDFDFKILGLVDGQWSTFTKRTKRFLGIRISTRWDQTDRWILPQAEALFIQDFKIDFTSSDPNPSIDKTDLVYQSKTNDDYLRNELEVDFNICSGLTDDEAYELGVENKTYKNTVFNYDYKPCKTIYDNSGSNLVKAEVNYIQKWYDILSTPRNIYKIKMLDNGNDRNNGNMLLHPCMSIYSNTGTTIDTQFKLLSSLEFDVKNNVIEYEGYL